MEHWKYWSLILNLEADAEKVDPAPASQICSGNMARQVVISMQFHFISLLVSYLFKCI